VARASSENEACASELAFCESPSTILRSWNAREECENEIHWQTVEIVDG